MNFRLFRQVTLSLLTTSALLTSTSFASDYTISAPSTVQNGGAGNILDGDDTLVIKPTGSISNNSFPAIYGTGTLNTIENAGSISTTGATNYGIFIPDMNTITNTGTITTDGDYSHAVFVQNGNTVTNSGTILTKSTNSFAIVGQNNNTFLNSGTISAMGSGSTGLAGLNNNTITNTGIISMSGTLSNGLYAIGANNTLLNSGTINATGNTSTGMVGLNNTTITNAGTINMSGTLSNGLYALGINNTLLNSGTINATGNTTFGMSAFGNTNTLTNTGTISTSGIAGAGMGSSGGDFLSVNNSGTITTSGNAFGIIVVNDSTVNNSGIIETSGANGSGIYAGTGNVVTHSGKIIATSSAAIEFAGSDNQLILNAPAFIGGAIQMGNFNVAEITTGRSHSNLWTFSGTPAGVGGSGPVPFAWDAGTNQFATLDPTALSAAPNVLANMVGALSDLTRIERNDSWWLQGYGNFSSTPAAGIYNDYTSLNGGIATGASFTLNENMDLGAFVGYQASNLNVNSRWVTSQSINSNGVVGAIYGSARMDNIFLDLSLYAGWSTNNSDRFVNDNLQTLGEDHALASFNSWFLSPEARVGVNIDTGDIWTMTPSATARFSNQWINGYTETGTNANATVGARQVQIFEGELELAATRDIQNGSFGMRGGVQFRQAMGAATQDITLLGQTLAMPLDMASSLGGYIGVDTSYNINQTSALNLSAMASYGANNSFNVAGSVGFNSEF